MDPEEKRHPRPGQEFRLLLGLVTATIACLILIRLSPTLRWLFYIISYE